MFDFEIRHGESLGNYISFPKKKLILFRIVQECIEDSSVVQFKKYALENGDYYKGSYNERGLRHGAGHYVFKNGAQYIGTYRRGLRHGTGKMIYPDHSIYQGDWISNVKHGRGKYKYRNEDYYDGEWSMDKRHGLGTYFRALTQCTFHGIWQNGYRNGPAKINLGEYKFHGTWFGDRIIGSGSTFALASQIMCSGYYKYENNSSSVWITTQLQAYDGNNLPQSPGDFVLGRDHTNVLRTVSEVDAATDYLINQTFVKKDIMEFTNLLVEHTFTTKEIRDITYLILSNVVSQ